jgi:hypothetical protein
MTLDDLKALIAQMINERLGEPPGFGRDRPVSEVLAEMRRAIWTPPSGAESSLDLLREDRDR